MSLCNINNTIIDYWDSKLVDDLKKGRVNEETDLVCLFHEKIFPEIMKDKDSDLMCYYNVMLKPSERGRRSHYDAVIFDYSNPSGNANYFKRCDQIIKEMNKNNENIRQRRVRKCFFEQPPYYPAIIMEFKSYTSSYPSKRKSIKDDIEKLIQIINESNNSHYSYSAPVKYAHALFVFSYNRDKIDEWEQELKQLVKEHCPNYNSEVKMKSKEKSSEPELMMKKAFRSQVLASNNTTDDYKWLFHRVGIGRVSFSSSSNSVNTNRVL